MSFPKDFLWGAATSSYQIEGAASEEGRGECIWTRFSHTPGNVYKGHTGDVACDHYHRYQEDVALMQKIGLDAYRFSISWPRVIPQGIGETNPKGLDFYDRLVDELLAAEIIPFVTLYHWDLPQALQDKGGWENPDSVKWFRDYAALMSEHLGDRVKNWVTHNEPWVVAFLGNMIGEHAPGYQDPRKAYVVAHHVLLSHGAAVPVLRENVPDAKIGLVNAESARTPASDTPEDKAAVELSTSLGSGWFLDPIYKGHYPPDAVEFLGETLDGIDLDAVSKAQQPLDYLGVNYYFRHYEKAGPDGAPQIVPQDDVPKTTMDWEIYPQGMLEMLRRINETYDPGELYITENGAAFDDPLPQNGVVEDPDRVDYLAKHFAVAKQAVEEGIPLKGYFVWSLMDNFEWAHGYHQTFGIIHVDFETMERTPKRSALYYKEWIANHQAEPV